MATEIVGLLIEFLLANIGIIISILINIFLALILFRLAALFGPFFKDSLLVAFGLMKDPNLFLIFGQSRRLGLEWRPFMAIQNTAKNDKTTEIVLVDRTQDSQIGSYKSKRGLLSLFNGKLPRENAYHDNGVYVEFDNNKDFRSWGFPAHVILQGTNKTVNPLDAMKQDQKVRLSSFAVIEAIEGWKAYFQGKLQGDMLTTKMFLIVAFILIFMLFINIVFSFNANGTLDGFKQLLESNKEVIQFALDQAKGAMPHIEPGGGAV